MTLTVLFFGCLIGLCGVAMAADGANTAGNPVKSPRFFVGTYNREHNGHDIALVSMEPDGSKLTLENWTGDLPNASFLAIHPNGKMLYAISEGSNGEAAALAIDPQTSKLQLLNKQSSGGKGPCHIELDTSAKFAMIANYNNGSISVLPLQEDGRLAPASCVIQHEGNSVDPGRQKGPHAHGIYSDPSGKFVLAVDLGLDKTLIYQLDKNNGKLTPNDPAFGASAPGAGPRHLAFGQNGRVIYVIHEMGNTITVYDFDKTSGKMTEIQTLTTLPADFKGVSYTSEIAVHPSGKFLYGSNRGHESMVVYAIDAKTGKLTLSSFTPTQGKFPRHFIIDPTGKFLLVGNQNSNNIVVFKINLADGSLEPTGAKLDLMQPACLIFDLPR